MGVAQLPELPVRGDQERRLMQLELNGLSRQLHEPHRGVMHCTYQLGMTDEEIAAALGLRLSSVREKRSRAVAAMRLQTTSPRQAKAPCRPGDERIRADHCLMAYLHRLRRREIAVRLALGAQRIDLERALAAAQPTGWCWARRSASPQHSQVAPSLPGSYSASPLPIPPPSSRLLLILVLGFGAAYLPARSAARTGVREAWRTRD